MFTNVRESLEVYGGVWITTDFITKEDLSKRYECSPNWHKFDIAIGRVTDIPSANTYFDNLEHVRQFVAQQGFELNSYSMLNVFDRLTCLQSLGIDPAVAKSLLKNSSVFALTV